jgi:MFS family permease
VTRRPILLLTFLAAYLLSYFYRSTNAVLAGDLQRDAGIGTEELGLMTSLFFATFALAQLPLGAALDRYGPRWVPAGLMLAAVAGAFITAAADGFAGLALGRALIGLGMAGVLMGALKAFAAWFEPQRFALVSSLFVAAGSLGALGATTPLTNLAASLGWRGVFVAVGVVTAAIALLLMVVVRAAPAGARQQVERGAAITPPGFGVIFRSVPFYRVALLVFSLTGGLFALQGLWGGPFMAQGLGLGLAKAAQLLFVLGIAVTVGYLSAGASASRFGTRRVMAAGAALAALSLAGLALLPPEPALGWIALLWASYGFATGHGVLGYAATRELFPAAAGRAVTAVNLFGIGGSALLQAGLGLVIAGVASARGFDPLDAPLIAYRAALWLTVALITLAWLFFLSERRGE